MVAKYDAFGVLETQYCVLMCISGIVPILECPSKLLLKRMLEYYITVIKQFLRYINIEVRGALSTKLLLITGQLRVSWVGLELVVVVAEVIVEILVIV
jgi:hypothetical protein